MNFIEEVTFVTFAFRTRIELATPSLTKKCSNQLNYRNNFKFSDMCTHI